MAADPLEEYREELERLFGEDLVSLTVYGSHATDAPEPGANASILVVVRTLGKEALEGLRKIAHRYARRGIPVPPVLTETFLRESADVFPVELLGMRERRRVLSGKDIVAEIDVTTGNLRHQVEFELKGKLLSLRRMYLTAFGGKEVADLMNATVGPVVSVARGLLLISDRQAPHGKTEIVDGIERGFGLSLPVMREILESRRKGKIPPSRAEELFFGFQEEVERLCSLVNSFPAAETP